ncbi:Chromatin structure-remodeling complex protein BSH [Glycine soja]|nr:chromatin structure-remodeling complex protein BSH-like isoform X1 [Glycine max]XP_028195753.1 chromatin structure-remodeling complex protein BSH-like isoform X1 [Glycine soja]|eukprot:XP_006593474.1 chromatin structure-remodeling complex protein BSH-like isoform X1 [Glycine max]
MKTPISGFYRNPVKFRMPTAENLVPIRLDIEIEGQRYKDAFTWNPSDPDSEVVVFAKRTVKDLKLPPAFVTQIAQSIQSQLSEFRSYEGQDMYAGEKIVPIKLDLRVNHTLVKDQFLWDLNNFESDPEEFARIFCKDTGIEDPEVGPAIAFAIREQLYEIAIQSVVSARESRMSKKGRRGAEYTPVSKGGAAAVDLVKLFGPKSSVVRLGLLWLNVTGKERSGTYMNLLWTYYPTRKLMPLKRRKREISGEFAPWSATPHQKGI